MQHTFEVIIGKKSNPATYPDYVSEDQNKIEILENIIKAQGIVNNSFEKLVFYLKDHRDFLLGKKDSSIHKIFEPSKKQETHLLLEILKGQNLEIEGRGKLLSYLDRQINIKAGNYLKVIK